MSFSDTASPATRRARLSRHVSFLAYDDFRFLKWAILTCVAALVLYIAVPPYGQRYGGGWAGYTLGTVGAVLILWLTWFGYRKRTYDPERKYLRPDGDAALAEHPPEDPSRLARRLSAHVYLGLALVVIATLHTGFHFGWNIHTLAYALMCVVIASGIYGVIVYSRCPRQMTENRENMTLAQMQAQIVAIDADLRRRVMPLDDSTATIIQGSLDNTPIGGSMWRQVTGQYPNCGTARALAQLRARPSASLAMSEETWRALRSKLDEKGTLVTRLRRDIRFKALMDIWLYLHVPVTFALLAALTAHIVSVFYM
jgi:hypothetical protein